MRRHLAVWALVTALALVPSGPASAAACSCSRNVALPGVNLLRAGAGVVSLDYGINLEGDPDAWRGLYVVDRFGDSMAGMYMPPMLVQTAALTVAVGLPRHFSLSATLPYMYKDNLGLSEMPGDTDLASFNDVDVTARWGHQSADGGAFYGFVEVPKHLGLTGTAFVEKAIANNVLIIPGKVFSARDTHFRLSFAQKDEVLAEGLGILRGLMV